MCDFKDWTAVGIRMGLRAFADLGSRAGPRAGRSGTMLTLIGVGTCEHPNWHHALARPTGSISIDPAIEGFTLVVTAPGAEEEPTGTHRAVVEWTGVVSSQAAVAEIRNARADGSDLLVEIQVR